MQTGILVSVTLLAWHPSGCPLCPCPGCLHMLQGTGFAQSQPSLLQPLFAGSGLITVDVGRSQGAVYRQRAEQEFPSCAHSLVQSVLEPPLPL